MYISFNSLVKSAIFALVQWHHMQKDFAVVEFCPYTVAKNFQSEQQYLPDKTKNETKINFWPTDNISIIQALRDVLTWLSSFPKRLVI